MCVIRDRDNQNPQMFSVYAKRKDGGVDCVGDFGKPEWAVAYAMKLGQKYAWPVHNLLG